MLKVINDRWEPSSNKMCAVVTEPLCSIGEMAVFNNVDLCLFSLRCWIVVGDRVAGEVVVGASVFATGLVLTVLTSWFEPSLLWVLGGVEPPLSWSLGLR